MGVGTPIGNIAVDLNPGGIVETIMVNDPDGTEYPSRGAFVEIVPSEKLSRTAPDVEGGMTTTITYSDPGDGRCQTVTHQTNVPAVYRTSEAQSGMLSSFDKMAAYLATV